MGLSKGYFFDVLSIMYALIAGRSHSPGYRESNCNNNWLPRQSWAVLNRRRQEVTVVASHRMKYRESDADRWHNCGVFIDYSIGLSMDITAKLQQHCQHNRDTGLTAAVIEDIDNAENQYALLSIFSSDVNAGGFAQFVYNANGIYIGEVFEILEKIEATETAIFLDRAINLCLDEEKLYQKFLAADFADSYFKKKLDKISEDYRKAEQSFEQEAEEYLSALITGCEAE
ncbi:hypothetical protein SIN8267_02595 [Sinobacterium norvegicum]|uniref:DNA mimic protein DMP19 C-terminal domain-containing protein n=2 Tax=Sinobacterium norvegicum TaxID=1641715 RepID=A0ABN8EL64_9GAMM|nr:hypothetical protein SIN8267_02595 [Sinobacterium norvegicum]